MQTAKDGSILKRVTQSFFGFFGYRITSSHTYQEPLMEADMGELYRLCAPFTMTSKERMYALYRAVEYVIQSGIPGDFVECGVWRGGSAMMIAYVLKKMGVTDRKIYLYDTFAGMSEPTKADSAKGDEVLATWKERQKGSVNEWCYASLTDVKQNMGSTNYPSEMLVYVEGKVENTIPSVAPEQIALLRLDTDWYESTKHELEHLFPRLAKAGVLIIDDYGSWPGSRKATDEYLKNKPMLLQRIDSSGRMGVKT
jgi:predicted O-methyltransferase YrrM